MGKNLDNNEYRRFKELSIKSKKGDLTPEEQSELEMLTIKKEGKQDIDWYNKFKSLYENSARLAFSYRPGTTVEFANQSGRAHFAMSNVAVTRYVTVPGRAKTMNDALNVYSRKLWTALNIKYRGIGVYEQSDVGVYLWCIVSLVEMIAYAGRIYGTQRRYKAMNKNFPKTMANAMGLDFESWNQGEALKNFLFNLNYEIERANALFMPKGLAVLIKHVSLASLMFLDDENTEKANIFFYEPSIYWLWTPVTFATGSAATAKIIKNSGKTPDDIISIIQEMIDALSEDQDVTKMGSDFFNIFKGSDSFKFQPLTEDYKVEPVYSEMWLEQWHNVETIGGYPQGYGSAVDNKRDITPLATSIHKDVISSLYPLPAPGLYLYQKDNVLQFNVFGRARSTDTALAYYLVTSGDLKGYYYPADSGTTSSATIPALSGDGIIDSWKEKPAEETVMELTRNKVRCSYITAPTTEGNKPLIEYDVFSDIICLVTDFYTYNDYTDFITRLSMPTVQILVGADLTITKFDWHPLRYELYSVDNLGSHVLDMPVGDLDNWAIVSRENLNKLNMAALLSLFDLTEVISIIENASK